MKNQAASTVLLQAAVQSAQELGDVCAMHALSSRMDVAAGRLAAAVMTAARTGSHAQFLRARAEAEVINPRLQQCLAVRFVFTLVCTRRVEVAMCPTTHRTCIGRFSLHRVLIARL